MTRELTREEAVEKALLYTFQLSGKDYRKIQTAMSEVAFIRALEQDGYIVAERATQAEAGLDVGWLKEAVAELRLSVSFVERRTGAELTTDDIVRRLAATPKEPVT